MAEVQRAANFDWVTARVECSAEIVFAQLQADAERNVERVNTLIAGAGPPWQFAVHEQTLSVTRRLHGKLIGAAFTLSGAVIRIEVTKGRESSTTATTTTLLRSDGECRLVVDGEELDRWQLLRRFLEPLFFDPQIGGA